MEFTPQKYRSPPPKPPRRRHSDELTISSIGTFLPNKKKYLDENLDRKDNKPAAAFRKSGCESLPANWTTNCLKIQEDEDSSLYRNSSDRLLFPDENTSISNSIFKKYDIKPSENTRDTNYFNSKCEDEVEYLHHILKVDEVLSKLNLEHSFNVMKSNSCGKNDLFFKNKSHGLKSFQKDYHRRHHSDPVLSCFDRSPTKNILTKSLKSHSFIGCVASKNFTKEYNSVRSCSTCKETHYLHEEIKVLKEINNKLWLHLCTLQASVENLTSPKGTTSVSFSELFSSLYYAQKAKDSAMEERLKIAIEDRDSALLELEEVIEILSRSFEDIDSVKVEEKIANKNVQELLHEIEMACNPSKLIQCQRLLLAKLHNSWEAKQDHLLHEFKFIITERDGLQEKVQKLEKELETLRLCSDLWQLDNKQWETSLIDVLCHVIQQRDSLLSNPVSSQSFDSSCCRSPYAKPSHSAEEYINSDCKTVWNLDDSNFSQKAVNLSSEQQDVCPQFLASDEIKLLKGKIVVLNKVLEFEISKREAVEEKCLRLERIVNVLRKKINGKNVGILV